MGVIVARLHSIASDILTSGYSAARGLRDGVAPTCDDNTTSEGGDSGEGKQRRNVRARVRKLLVASGRRLVRRARV